MTAKLDWSQIDTVLLDMDGTLLDLHFDWHFWMEYLPQAYAERNGLSQEEAERIIHEKIQQQQGTLNWYCLDYWSEALQLPVSELKREVKHLIQTHPDVINFLAKLKQLGKTVVMVTNAHRDSLAIKLEMTEIGDYFDHLISAHDFGLPKEDIRIWSEIQTVQPYDPKHTLLIDDNLHALRTAQQYGIQHLLCAVHVSPKLDKIDPQEFDHFETYNEIIPL
ncbi:GMP/IMP nucleotidase [Thiomicrorhabdus sp. zzn3]|uniref:GMP/IMP nucleotidase n=1 Tax=Thiomicrorhabdus sp. zzn3 TaxID=3039775 RepID=UPI0024370F87|nr:GMP/IMP nucleotidase [Thiomicrorhabdus sp. zzn3]MDG6777262.1 GMP/IMP nucleotidase [Thiomicrorhabdus sp. zzn3]